MKRLISTWSLLNYTNKSTQPLPTPISYLCGIKFFSWEIKFLPGTLFPSRSNLYKNEIGFAFPRLDTLIRLYEDFDLSMDWLLFNSGSMHTKEKQAAPATMEKETESTVNESPEIKELLAAVQQDLVLRHELLAYFYKYKKNQPKQEQ